MSQKVSVVFGTTQAETETFINQSSGDFSPVFQDGELQFVVKEVKETEQTLEKVRMIAGNISRDVKARKIEKIYVNEQALQKFFTALDGRQVVTAFVEGWHLGAYQFDTYKSEKNATPTLKFMNEPSVKNEVTEGTIRAAATAFSRDLMNEIPSKLTPETFPTILADEFADTGVEVVVHDKKALEKMQMNGLLAVNRGSKHDPAFIELHYEGDASKPLVALVGKGVTFDTGGISLKSGRDISDMRMDMGGAAAVAGAIKLLAEANADVNVVGLIQTVENMPGKDAMLPGDIIQYKNGKSVQIGNTDAEGRLILADGIIRAGELQAEYIVDIATLTGAIARALGPKIGGIFGKEPLMAEMKQVGEASGDFVWPMPLVEAYDKTLKSDYADFKNISTQGEGGAITAALFLRRFVPENTNWIHVDMAGVMESKAEGYYGDSATGFGARLLADYAIHVSK